MSSINWLNASLRGRLGEVVGSSWRGKPYTKMYVPPTDPKTTGQTDVRGIFAHVGHLAHLLYKPVLEPYTYPVPHKHTKYNQMMMINKELYDDKVYDQSKVQILKGSLLSEPVESAGYDTDSGEADIVWYKGDDPARYDDTAIIVIYSEETDTVNVSIAKRQTQGVYPAIGKGLDAAKMHVYLMFVRQPQGAGDTGETSTTSYSTVEAVTRATPAKPA
ncbi:hypothetical protein NO2_1610 [Candidatus Termititenax persephonae]|uniref:Uncharacterized protein n=1 Tax=Candidatus Termititenax persephonae TaxID=2218525 RepID=A0A388TIV2_9BACT|nr:hypothetical protein NO2_1610 [Candidatus Termititenax persephonae]